LLRDANLLRVALTRIRQPPNVGDVIVVSDCTPRVISHEFAHRLSSRAAMLPQFDPWPFSEREDWLTLFSAVVFLTIAVTAAVRARQSPLAPPLSRTTAALFAYETCELLKHLTQNEDFHYLECGAAALVAPTTVALVVQFLGEWRRLRVLIIVGASYFVGIFLLCVGAIFIPSLESFPGEAPWALAMLAGLFPEMLIVGSRLVRHARAADPEERARTQLLVLALVIGVGSVSSDLASIAGMDTPRVAAFGLVASALLLAFLALRLSFLAGVTGLLIASAFGIASLVILLNLLAFWVVGANTLLIVVVSLAITVATIATLRPLLATLSESRARARYLVTLGRFSAQMAHDLKNPLAAIRGAAQFLTEEKARGSSLDDHAAFVELILEQSDRLARVVNDYQRIGRAEVVRTPVSLSELANEVATAQRAAASTHRIDVKIDDAVGEIAIDRDLFAGALENLVKNAREAGGKSIELGATRLGARVRIYVKDDGPGMDVRTRERAFDEFYTTKATGSGLGLAFVGRVAEAHGGRARIDGEKGVGTTVAIEIPA
jgi:signal transduction histidine kinase